MRKWILSWRGGVAAVGVIVVVWATSGLWREKSGPEYMLAQARKAAIESEAAPGAFDEAAWQEAMDVLREEVGAGAVDAGCIKIARKPVSTPRAGLVHLSATRNVEWARGRYWSTSAEVYVDLWGDRSTVVSLQFGRHGNLGGPCEIEVAQTDKATAEHIWRVLSYLRNEHAEISPAWAAAAEELGANSITGRFSQWRISPAETAARTYGILEDLFAACAVQYVQGLRDNGTLTFDKSRDIVVPALSDVAVVLAETAEESGQLFEAAELLLLNLDKREIPALNSVLRRYEPSSAVSALSMLPVVGERLYEKYARPMYQPSFLDWGWPGDAIKSHIWAIENVLGKTPEEQVKILSGAAFASKEMTAKSFRANEILVKDWPEKWREEVLAHFSELGSEQKVMSLDQYRVMFPGDSTLAELAKGDGDREVRLKGVSCLPGADAATALCDFVRSKGAYPDAAGMTGTRGDVDILLYVLEQPDALLTKLGAEREDHREVSADGIRYVIVNALVKYDDPRVIEALLPLAAPSESDSHNYSGALLALAEKGDGGVLATLRQWSISRPDDEWLNMAVVLLDVRLSDDPIETLAGLDSQCRGFSGCWPSLWLYPMLVDRCTVEQLTAALAEEKYANIWPFVYGALVARRAMDEGARQ